MDESLTHRNSICGPLPRVLVIDGEVLGCAAGGAERSGGDRLASERVPLTVITPLLPGSAALALRSAVGTGAVGAALLRADGDVPLLAADAELKWHRLAYRDERRHPSSVRVALRQA